MWDVAMVKSSSDLCFFFFFWFWWQTSLMYKLRQIYVGRSKFRLTIFPGSIDRSLVVAMVAVFLQGRNWVQINLQTWLLIVKGKCDKKALILLSGTLHSQCLLIQSALKWKCKYEELCTLSILLSALYIFVCSFFFFETYMT